MNKTGELLLNIMMVLAAIGLILAIISQFQNIQKEAEKVQTAETNKPSIQRVDLNGVSCFVLEKYRGIDCVVTP